jgi:hypothetical protein
VLQNISKTLFSIFKNHYISINKEGGSITYLMKLRTRVQVTVTLEGTFNIIHCKVYTIYFDISLQGWRRNGYGMNNAKTMFVPTVIEQI